MSFREVFMSAPFDVHAHARPILHPSTTLACLSLSEIENGHLPSEFCSVGVHPWWTLSEGASAIEALKIKVKDLSLNPQIRALGETGLDRARKESWGQQEELFHWHWDLAEERALPMIIHKVRSGSDFQGLMKARRPKTPWIFHDYHGNNTETEQFLRLHSMVKFSIGKSLLKEGASLDWLQTVSLEQIFIETDEESQDQLPHYYKKLSELRNQSVHMIQQKMAHNFSEIFKIS